jgi:hypothetical protein
MDGTTEWWETARNSSLRTWKLPSRPANNDSITRHRYSDPSSDPAPVKVRAMLSSLRLDLHGCMRPLTAPPSTLTAASLPDRSPPRHPPPTSKLDSARVMTPALCQPTSEACKAVWASAVDGYVINKSRAMYGSSFRFE